MRSLAGRFDYVVAAIEEGRDLSAMTIEGLMGSLCSHEHRMNHISAGSVEQAFQSKVNVPGKDKGISSYKKAPGQAKGGKAFGSKNIFRKKERHSEAQTSEGRRYDKSSIQCFRCKEYGHYRSEYNATVPKNNFERANLAQDEVQENKTLLLACSD